MHLLLPLLLVVLPVYPTRLLPDDPHAFPKFRVAFLKALPLPTDTAARWLATGLRGGESEFLDQPWPKEIDSGVVDPNPSPPSNYTLEHMNMGPKDSYLCLIPKPHHTHPPVHGNDESDFDPTPSRSWSLLQPLSGTCLYHRQGWFTYSYCHNEQIRQFKEAANSPGGHRPPQEDPDWESYTLGKAPKPGADLTVAEQNAQAVNLELARSAGSRYLVQRWGDGTLCDKTKKPREVEVQFHCSMTMTDTILFVKEAKTCSYVLVINTPRLCGEPGFKSHRDSSEEHQIRCREIVDSVPSAHAEDSQARIPDSDQARGAVGASRPAPPTPKEPKIKAEGIEVKDSPYGEILRKTLEAIMGGGDARKVEELSGDKDNVVFEIVEEIDLADGEQGAMDKLTEALRAAGFNVKDKAPSGKNKKGDKKTDKEQGKKNRKPSKGAAWHEEL